MKTRRFMTIFVLASMMTGAHAVRAEVPIPSPDTPTLYGAEQLEPGTLALGGTVGYPETGFDFYWGVMEVFDLGAHLGFTYGHHLSGLRQRIGLDLHVPLRFTLFHAGIVAGGLRASPYFMIGQYGPSVSVGADVAFLIDIALPKLFKIIVGPEIRTGLATLGTRRRITGYDGGVWANMGLETLLAERFHLGAMFHGGGRWGTGGLGGGGLFRVKFYLGVVL